MSETGAIEGYIELDAVLALLVAVLLGVLCNDADVANPSTVAAVVLVLLLWEMMKLDERPLARVKDRLLGMMNPCAVELDAIVLEDQLRLVDTAPAVAIIPDTEVILLFMPLLILLLGTAPGTTVVVTASERAGSGYVPFNAAALGTFDTEDMVLDRVVLDTTAVGEVTLDDPVSAKLGSGDALPE